MTTASVIVPAHNEAASIAACLTSVLAEAEPGEFDVVVACNGCTDRTAEIARTFDGVRVLELQQASKVAALNAAEAVTDVFPRIYLDGDTQLPTATLRAIAEALRGGALTSGPTVQIDDRESDALVRAYYRVWLQLPYARRGLGSGVYAVSKEGRRRFDRFPDIVADDLFVHRSFRPEERVVVDRHSVVKAPASIRTLVNMRTRVMAGNQRLHAEFPDAHDEHAPSGLPQLARADPRLIPSIAVYAGVTALGKLRARWRVVAGRDERWDRDHASRGD